MLVCLSGLPLWFSPSLLDPFLGQGGGSGAKTKKVPGIIFQGKGEGVTLKNAEMVAERIEEAMLHSGQ